MTDRDRELLAEEMAKFEWGKKPHVLVAEGAALRAIARAREEGRVEALEPALPALEAAREAGSAVIDRKASTYKARNGREVGIQGDDGEMCWIVHSDEITQLEAATTQMEAAIRSLKGQSNAG